MQTIQNIINTCSHPVPHCHIQKIIALDAQLASGAPYTLIGGQRIHQCKVIVRFKIGRRWRLIYLLKGGAFEPYCLITRQKFDQLLRRISKHH
jgi:hypothetical protein